MDKAVKTKLHKIFFRQQRTEITTDKGAKKTLIIECNAYIGHMPENIRAWRQHDLFVIGEVKSYTRSALSEAKDNLFNHPFAFFVTNKTEGFVTRAYLEVALNDHLIPLWNTFTSQKSEPQEDALATQTLEPIEEAEVVLRELNLKTGTK